MFATMDASPPISHCWALTNGLAAQRAKTVDRLANIVDELEAVISNNECGSK